MLGHIPLFFVTKDQFNEQTKCSQTTQIWKRAMKFENIFNRNKILYKKN